MQKKLQIKHITTTTYVLLLSTYLTYYLFIIKMFFFRTYLPQVEVVRGT